MEEHRGQQQEPVAQFRGELPAFDFDLDRRFIFSLKELETASPNQSRGQGWLVILRARTLHQIIKYWLCYIRLSVTQMLEGHERHGL